MVAFLGALAPIVDSFPAPLLDALDHLCHLVEGDPEFEKEFYAASTPDEMVTAGSDWAELRITQVDGQNGSCIGSQIISCNQLHIPANDERGAS